MKIRLIKEKTASELIIEQIHKDKELKEMEKIKEDWEEKVNENND